MAFVLGTCPISGRELRFASKRSRSKYMCKARRSLKRAEELHSVKAGVYVAKAGETADGIKRPTNTDLSGRLGGTVQHAFIRNKTRVSKGYARVEWN